MVQATGGHSHKTFLVLSYSHCRLDRFLMYIIFVCVAKISSLPQTLRKYTPDKVL